MTEYYALAACIILAALFVFQLALIAGLPLGSYAWGGQNSVLPKKFRIASISSLLLYVIFSLIILSKSSLLELIINDALVTISMWVLVAYFFIGVAMNAISRSKKERLLMTPVALVLALLFLMVARS